MAARAWVHRISKPVFGRYLIVTNTLGCATLMSLGDIIVQNIEQSSFHSSERRPSHRKHLVMEKQENLDWHRVGRMFTVGLILGPFNHCWYSVLDKVLPGKTGTIVAKKILGDQLIASPYFAFAFFMGMGTLEGQSLNSSFGEFKSKFWQVYKMDWTVWPAAQAINFFFIPTQYRVLYVSFVTLGWNTFLSFTKHRKTLKSRNNAEENAILPVDHT